MDLTEDFERKISEVPESRLGTSVQGPGRFKRTVISAFLLFYIVAVVSWSMPPSTLLFIDISKKLNTYMRWAGVAQFWAMFAPQPLNLNIRMEAEVTYRDGHKNIWRFPDPPSFGYFRRYFEERYRKYSADNLREDKNAAIWPDAARYIARLNNDPGNPPVTVKLVRNWSEIAPPGSYKAEPWHQFVFFTYPVKPGDLQ